MRRVAYRFTLGTRDGPGRVWWAGLVVLAGFGVLYSASGNLPWVVAILGQVGRSASAIRVSGPPPSVPGLSKALAYMCLALGNGFLASRLLLRRSLLRQVWSSTVGLGLALGLAFAGLPGIWALCLGRVGVPVILGGEVGIACILVALSLVPRTESQGRPSAAVQFSPVGARSRSAGHWAELAVWVLVTLVIIVIMFQVIMAPVTEWDALIYHVAAARLWYLGRPSPAVHFGPSVGIELSGNYPPLFPALGLSTSVVGGAFETLSLRVTSPLALLSVVMMVHGLARHWWNRSAGRWAVLLLIGCPAVLIFSMEATNYLLVAALVVATLVAAEAALTSSTILWWAPAGGVAGLAFMSNYVGALGAIALVAILMVSCRAWGLSGLSTRCALAAGAFALIAVPWLARDWIVVGDPVYPLAAGMFHARTLGNVIYLATLAELRTSAESAWAGSQLPLAVSELITALSGRALLALGGAAGLLLGIARGFRRDAVAAWLSLTVLAYVAVLMAPGWYWTRYLIPVLPLMAMLAARAFVELRRHWSAPAVNDRVGRVFWIGSRSVLALAVGLSVGVAVVLPVAGPEQFGVATPSLPSSYVNYLTDVRSAGSPTAALWYTFSGDYLAWQWLNQHTSRDRYVATLDPRTLYLNNPSHVVYLDGRRALPLLHITRPAEMVRLFQRLRVQWVVVPENAEDPATYDPVLSVLPLVRYLGTRWFPLRAVFSVNDVTWLTEVYSIGGPLQPVAPAVFPGFTSPPPSGREYTVAAGSVGAEIQVPVEDFGAGRVLRWRYCVQPHAVLSFRRLGRGAGNWVRLDSRDDACGSGWASATLPVPRRGGTGFVVGLRAVGGDVVVRGVTVEGRGV